MIAEKKVPSPLESGWRPLGIRAPNVDRGDEFLGRLHARYREAREALNRDDDSHTASPRAGSEFKITRCGQPGDVALIAGREAKIEAVLRSLPILPEKELIVPSLVAGLAEMTAAGASPHFRPANTATVDKQLVDLRTRTSRLVMTNDRGGATARKREQLALLIRGLSSDTIQALANARWPTIAGTPASFNIGWFRTELPAALERGDPVSSEALQIVERVASSASFIGAHGTPAGRPRHFDEHAVGWVLARQYKNLTGLDPTLSRVLDPVDGVNDRHADGGRFYVFASRILEALNFPQKAIHAVIEEANAMRGRAKRRKK